ncbi:MAG: CPBP family intramembrane metalloprotease [Gemmataceae bacterium]|nr:CPBP family intramembrane metalloprotease [Gemmataceae bacterium]
MDRLNELTWYAIAYAWVVGVAILGIVAAWLLAPTSRRAWLPIARLRPGAWIGRDTFFVFCVYHGLPMVITATLFQMGFFTPLIGPAPDRSALTDSAIYINRCQNIASPLGFTLTLGTIFFILYARSGTRLHHFGLSWTRLWPNVGLGLVAAMGAIPVVIGLHMLVQFVLPGRDHSLTTLSRLVRNDWEWWFIGFQVVIVAPIMEEVVFRGLIQGWLRRASLSGHLVVCAIVVLFGLMVIAEKAALVVAPTEDVQVENKAPADAKKAATRPATVIDYLAPGVVALLLVGGYAWLMLRIILQFELREGEIQHWQLDPLEESLAPQAGLSEDDARERRRIACEQEELRQRDWSNANAQLAWFGTAMLFAMVHYGAWPAPISLMPLGLIFGWLAWRTQSLIAPIVLHAVFNLTSFIALYGTVMESR